MLPDPVSNPGPLTYESGALPIALRGPANMLGSMYCQVYVYFKRGTTFVAFCLLPRAL